MSKQILPYQDSILHIKGPIFVFGASGFIGANLFDQIFQLRKDCYALTHDATKAWRLKLLNVPTENVIHCDILSHKSVQEIFDRYKPRTIFNLAAYGAYSKQKNVNMTYETNVNGRSIFSKTARPTRCISTLAAARNMVLTAPPRKKPIASNPTATTPFRKFRRLTCWNFTPASTASKP